jgi:DNA-binding MurR/RpiR family transcriptional regulator
VDLHSPSTVALPSPLQGVRDALPHLGGAKRRVAELILADPAAAGAASITALAHSARTQPAVISRLSILLGYSGYRALRAAIASDSGRETQAAWQGVIGSQIHPGDTAERVLSILTARQFAAMRGAMASIDLPTMERLADLIVAAERVHIFAEWGDLPPALELHKRLYRIGIPAWLDQGAYASTVGAGRLETGDVGLTISRSGASATGARFLELARSGGATTAVITGDPSSRMGAGADITVFTGTASGTSWTDHFAGRMSDSLAAGLLWILVAQRVPESFTTTLSSHDD